MADGSVGCLWRTNLQNALKGSGGTARWSGLFTLAAGVSAGSGRNRILLP